MLSHASSLDRQPAGRILVVDDDERVILAIMLVIEGLGYQVRGVSDAAAALDDLTTEDFDVLVTDVHMGKISGFDVLARARASRPSLRVVVMSADPDPEIGARALRMGAVAFLAKPFDRGQMAEAIGVPPRDR